MESVYKYFGDEMHMILLLFFSLLSCIATYKFENMLIAVTDIVELMQFDFVL